MSDIAGVAACVSEAFLCLVLVFGYGLCESPLYSNSKSANPFFPFLFKLCQGDFHYSQPGELAFYIGHCHASQSQKVL